MSQRSSQTPLPKNYDAFQELLRAYGPIVGGATLVKVLAFPSAEAFRQAVARGTVPVKLFELKGRRGRFAFTKDIAAWLADTESATKPTRAHHAKREPEGGNPMT